MLKQSDLFILKERGIDESVILKQLKQFADGFPSLKICKAASAGNGILKLDDAQMQHAVEQWDNYLKDGGAVTKFVPASGAASRMFKSLLSYVNEPDAQPDKDVQQLLDNIDKVPFYSQLSDVARRLYGKDIEQLMAEGRQKDIISAIVSPQGMNYGNLPKALLTFHKYAEGATRTPLEEQMMEGSQMAASGGNVNLHFTVSSNHRTLFEEKIKEVLPQIKHNTNLDYNISLSEQLKSTDTVAATDDNDLFRDTKGNLVFRPGGHGALIQNLNMIQTPVVFIKNIDNVVPESRRDISNQYKKVIAGVLIENVRKIQQYYNALAADTTPSEALLDEINAYLKDTVNVSNPAFADMTAAQKRDYLMKKLDRPVRVCGMVINEGEPGGGPFIVEDKDGATSAQILESSQIDMKVPEYREMMQHATHFNPVDLVCYIRRPDGTPYDLPQYVDESTGFISSKSYEGRALKALELPGLWNGAMSDWNTIFVEVPAATFNPVKTVNDLLRPVHQAQ